MNTDNIKKLEKEEPSSSVDEPSVSNESRSSEDEEADIRKNEAMKEVFQIPDIVQELIEDVEDLNDLKECRLVNSMWEETTTKVMIKKNSALVALTLDSRKLKQQKYQRCKYWHRDRYLDPRRRSCYLKSEAVVDYDNLTYLKEILGKSTQFPCSTFVIYRWNLRDLVMKDFFKVVGDSMKHLKLVRVNGESVKFVEFLGVNCPNLETLYMEGGCMEDGHIVWGPQDISFEFSKLKMLEMRNIYLNGQRGESPFKILTTLIAPNLQVIRGFNLSRDWEAVSSAGKIHCIKDFNFSEATDDNLTKLVMFFQVGPQLESLNLDPWFSLNYLDSDLKSKWLRLIQKFLDLSKTTLKYFSFYRICEVFENLDFAQFPRLQEIQINSLTAEERGVKYPYEILSDDICPNLQIIKGFHMSRDVQGVATAGKIHCVKKLDLFLDLLGLDLLKLFVSGSPQLEILILCHHSVGVGQTDLDLQRELTGCLEKLLELSKDTLRGFKFDGVGDDFEDMTFPTFSKLQVLKVIDEPLRIFPKGINLTETYPNLETLDLYDCFHFRRDESWDESFPPDAFAGSLNSVKTLIFHEGFTDIVKGNFRMMCPNAKVFYIPD